MTNQENRRVHQAAASGYGRGSGAYVEGRPSYHPDIVAEVAAALASGPVVDLGAGTGIATAALAGAGLDVIAIEPVESMRSHLVAAADAAQVLDGTAEAIPLPDASVAAVVVAQAFHWFDHQPALDEIARVLRPGAALVTLWNVRDETVDWMAELTAITDVHAGDTPRYRSMIWRDAIENDHRFRLRSEHAIPNPQSSSVEGVIARTLSTSFIASLDDETQAEVLAQVHDLVSGLGQRFEFPYTTEAQVWSV